MIDGVKSIRSLSQYDNSVGYDVIVIDETIPQETIDTIRLYDNEVTILDTGTEKKLALDQGTNAYLQKPYTQEQLFQAIALGGLTHHLLVTFPLSIKDEMEKRGVFCL